MNVDLLSTDPPPPPAIVSLLTACLLTTVQLTSVMLGPSHNPHHLFHDLLSLSLSKKWVRSLEFKGILEPFSLPKLT